MWYAQHHQGAIRATQSDEKGIGLSHVLSLGRRGNLITRAPEEQAPNLLWGNPSQAEKVSPLIKSGGFCEEYAPHVNALTAVKLPCVLVTREAPSQNPPDFFRHTPIGYSLSHGGLARVHPVRMLPVDLPPPHGIA